MTAARPQPIDVRGLRLQFGERTYVMGIINITPDSFSGDGLLGDVDLEGLSAAAVATAVQMVEDGADLIDVGGESTRPGHQAVGTEEELARVGRVVPALRAALPSTPISIDTSKPEVAETALSAGADLLNDVAAVTRRAALAPIAATHQVPYILMHWGRHSRHDDIVVDVVSDLQMAVDRALAAGCAPETLIVDPGIGFGKSASQNLVLLRDLRRLRTLGQPMLLGTSRKSTIGRVLGLPEDQRLEGTLATTALGIASGVDIVRVHDVAANVRVARMSDAIVRGGWQDADENATPAPG